MKYDAVRALPCPEPLTAYSTAPRRLGMLIGCLALAGLGCNALAAERITIPTSRPTCDGSSRTCAPFPQTIGYDSLPTRSGAGARGRAGERRPPRYFPEANTFTS